MKIAVGSRQIEVRQTLSDRVVGWFNPAAQLQRLRARASLSLVGATPGGYAGGIVDRRQTRNWRPLAGSANADTVRDLPFLRARSRDLARNVPVACGALATVVTNVVGEGLDVVPSIDRATLGLSDDEAEAWEAEAKKEFDLWCGEADFTRVQCFHELQALVFRAALESGDCLTIRRYRPDPGTTYGTRLQVIEADRISNPNGAADTAQIVAGVNLDGDGVAVAYSVASRHPGDFLTSAAGMAWHRVPARDADGRGMVLHLFDRLRPDQARGVPYLAPVIEALKQLGNYTDSEATAAVVASMFTAFVTSEQSEDAAPIVGTSSAGDSSLADDELKLAPGAILDLAPGEKVEIANPMRPNTGFDSFVQAFLRQIGTALELPHEVLIKSFTASYSASRAALEMAWQFFCGRRRWLSRRFCQPVYEWVIEEAVATGRLAAPGFFDDARVRRAYCGADWIGAAAMSLDPVKEATADEIDLRNNVKTRAQIIRERTGGSWEKKLAQMGAEKRGMDEAGLTPAPAAASPGAKAPAAAPDDGDDDHTDAPDSADAPFDDAGDQETD